MELLHFISVIFVIMLFIWIYLHSDRNMHYSKHICHDSPEEVEMDRSYLQQKQRYRKGCP